MVICIILYTRYQHTGYPPPQVPSMPSHVYTDTDMISLPLKHGSKQKVPVLAFPLEDGVRSVLPGNLKMVLLTYFSCTQQGAILTAPQLILLRTALSKSSSKLSENETNDVFFDQKSSSKSSSKFICKYKFHL